LPWRTESAFLSPVRVRERFSWRTSMSSAVRTSSIPFSRVSFRKIGTATVLMWGFWRVDSP